MSTQQNNLKPVLICLDPKMWKHVQILGEKQGRSASSIVREFVQHGLNRHGPQIGGVRGATG
jgi:hypothetical protein